MKYIILVILLAGLLLTGCNNTVFDATKETEKYAYYADGELVIGDLITDSEWQGNQSREIEYNAKKAPWVFNANFDRTSDIAAKYDVSIYRKEYGLLGMERVHNRGIESIAVINDIGEYVIDIRVSGMSWKARVGIEP